MKAHCKSLSARSIAKLKRSERIARLRRLNDNEAALLLRYWPFWARDEQHAPNGLWRVWLFMGGRGTGKTRAGAEWIATGVSRGSMRRVALIGATFHDARAVMIEGMSGLLGVSKGARYEPSKRRVSWPNGAVATVLSAEEPDGVRGHQFDACWGDEMCKWTAPQEALDMLRMALRIGEHPRMAITTTPRNIPALKALMEAKGTALTHGTTRANAANLAPGFVADLEARYLGTRLGRQELDAEIVEDREGALWQRAWIEQGRVSAVPEMSRVVVAVDPPASSCGAECGIVVVGIGKDGHGYVLADRSLGGLSPAGWARRVSQAYEAHEADAVVAESNQGGEMVKDVLAREMPNVPIKLLHASRGKQTRAAPASLLYERGQVHHLGVLAELEDQLCLYDGTGESPDRLDALVWALAELFPRTRSEPNVRCL